jgi:hypothetical protein
MAIPWATNLLHFHLNKPSNLALFCLATVLVTFKKMGLFFPNHLVTLNLCLYDDHHVRVILNFEINKPDR